MEQHIQKEICLTMGKFRLLFLVMKLKARPGYAPTKVSPRPFTICAFAPVELDEMYAALLI